jgi:voltage-gated potassium channel
MASIKYFIYNHIRDDDDNDLLSDIIDGIIVFLIIINVLIIFLDTFQNIRNFILPLYKYIDIFSIIIFSIEYILRIWTSDLIYDNKPPTKARIKYIFSPKAIIDMISLLSFYLPLFSFNSFRILRIVRLVRILSLLKVNRYSKAMVTLGKVIKNKSLQLISSFFIVSVLIIFASLLMYYIENEAQPGTFDNAFSSLWWAIATLTTVGYGDIYPITIIGKILGIFISLMGIAIIAIPTGIISAGFIEQINEDKKEDNENIQYCPHCGKKYKIRGYSA